jgi:hypothetical protein
MLQSMSSMGYNTQNTQSNQTFQLKNALSTEQSEKLSASLSNYDTKNLTTEDALKIVAEIKELGIREGAGLESALSEAGIDAQALAEQAGIKGGEDAGRPPPPPPFPQDGGPSGSGEASGTSSLDEGIVSLIADAVESYAESDDETETVWSLLQPALEEAGYDTSEPLIDFYL